MVFCQTFLFVIQLELWNNQKSKEEKSFVENKMMNLLESKTRKKVKKIIWDGFVRRIIFFLVVIVVGATFFIIFDLKKSFSGEKETTEAKEERIEFQKINQVGSNDKIEIAKNLILKCENNLWVKIDDFEGGKKKVVGVLSASQLGENEEKRFWLDNKTRLLISKKEIVDFFENRKVEVLATEKNERLRVAELRCFDKDKKNQSETENSNFRGRAMKYVSERLDILSLVEGSWQAKNFSWPKKNGTLENEYVFVQFEGQKSGSAELVSHLLLLKVLDEDGKIVVENIAFFNQGNENWEMVQGSNIFSEVTLGDLYVFEEGLKSWVKVN